MKLIVGLGNPGEKYAKTRHNIGFMVIDELAKHLELPSFDQPPKFEANVLEGEYTDKKLLLVKPTTMMNLSGRAIQKLMHFYKIDLSDVWVVHDEFELPFGQLRIRQGGSSAGHNGIKSVSQAVGEDYLRYRVGVGNQTLRSPIPADVFVLSNFSSGEQTSLPKIVEGTVQAIVNHLEGQPEPTTINLLQ